MNYQDFFIKVRKALSIDNDQKLLRLVSQLLEISESGAYKKVKGITKLTLDEVNTICQHSNLNIDLVDKEDVKVYNPFKFYCDDLVLPPATYEQWASNILNHSLDLNKYKSEYKIWSYQSEISYFHLMPFRFLLYFKLYAWNRSSWKIPTLPKFSIQEFSSNYALNSLLEKINEHFVSYEGIEIWHVNFLDGILDQIKYFHQLKIFKDRDDLTMVIKDLRRLINHLNKIAETGKKQLFGKKGKYEQLQVYLNYTHTSSSVMFIKSSQFKMIYNLFLHPNYIRTSDENVCSYTEQWINKVINQSALISSSGEIARNKFFESLETKISLLESELSL